MSSLSRDFLFELRMGYVLQMNRIGDGVDSCAASESAFALASSKAYLLASAMSLGFLSTIRQHLV